MILFIVRNDYALMLLINTMHIIIIVGNGTSPYVKHDMTLTTLQLWSVISKSLYLA